MYYNKLIMDVKSINKIHSKSLQIKQKQIGSDMVIKFNGAGFWNVDSDDDMILPEAFDRSLVARGPQSSANAKIAFCYQHDLRQPLGRFTSLVVENSNLKAEAVFDDIPLVKNVVIPQVNSGTLNNTSIGYRYTSNCKWMSPLDILEEYGERMPIDKKNALIERYGSMNTDKIIYVCKELLLHEISIVTIGANDDTEIFGGKSIEEVSEEFTKTIEEIKSQLVGLTTDEQYNALQRLDRLESIKSHLTDKQSKKSTKDKDNQDGGEKVFTIEIEKEKLIHEINI